MSELSKKLWQLSLNTNNYTAENMMIELQDLSHEATQNECDEILGLRRMLCIAASTYPYTDDGELQDNSILPHIDYLRDSVEQIQRKKLKRYADKLSQIDNQ